MQSDALGVVRRPPKSGPECPKNGGRGGGGYGYFGQSYFKPRGTLRITLSESPAGNTKFIQTPPKGKFGIADLFESWFTVCTALPLRLERTLPKSGSSLSVVWKNFTHGKSLKAPSRFSRGKSLSVRGNLPWVKFYHTTLRLDPDFGRVPSSRRGRAVHSRQTGLQTNLPYQTFPKEVSGINSGKAEGGGR